MLLVLLLVLVVVVVGADYGFRAVMEERVARSAQTELGLPHEPDVDLRAFPFALAFLRRHLDEVGVAAAGVEAEGLRLDRVDLELRDVSFDREAFIGAGGTITAGSGRGEVTVSDDAVSDFLDDEGVPVSVEFTGPGVDVRQSDLGLAVSGRLRLDGSALVFASEAVPQLEFEVGLPQVVPGLTYRRVTIADGQATAVGSLAGATIEVTG